MQSLFIFEFRRFLLEDFVLYKKITPCLLFDGRAHEAAKFYVSVFKKSKITFKGE